MNNKLLKILSSIIIGAAVSTSAVVPVGAFNTRSNYGNYSDIHVVDSISFANAVTIANNSSHNHTTNIVLDGDIFINKNVEILSSVFIDLNGYSINFLNGAELIIGGKIFSHTEDYTIYHPGYYVKKTQVVSQKESSSDAIYDVNGNLIGYEAKPEKKIVQSKYVWIPGWTETKTRDVYDYSDDLSVSIKGGWINGANGKDGRDGVENTFTDCDGKDGENGSNTIKIVSGTLHLNKIKVAGGNGGNGGDGKYQAIAHVPFFTGNGGNGGKGGNAGSAVVIERPNANLIQGKSVILESGTPGRGGSGSEANKNHWVGKGKHGSNGKDGKQVRAIEQ